MNLDTTTIKLLFLLLPGLLANFTYGRLVSTYQDTAWYALARTFTFAAICYLPYLIFAGKFPLIERDIDTTSVFMASLLSVPIGFVVAFVSHKRLINKLGMHLGVSTRYGGEDVWEIANREIFPERWVVVRDLRANLIYYGYIQAYSESEKERELLLGDVDVFFWYYRKESLLSRVYLYIP